MTTTPKDDKGFEDLLPLEARRFAAGEWTIHGKDGQQLFEVQGAAFSDWLVKTLNDGQAKDDAKERCLQILADIKDDLLSSEDPNSYSRWEWGVHDGLDAAMKAIEDNLPASAALRDRAERAEVEAKRYKELESAMHTEFKKVCKDRRQLEKAVEEKDALLDKQRDALASLTAQVAAKEGEIEGLRAELAAIESHPIDRHDQYESILLSLKEETAKGDTERLAKLATSHLKDAIIDASKTHQAWVMRTNQMKRWKEKAGKAIDQNEEDRQHLSRFGAIIEKMGNELSLAQTELETKGAELLAIARRITDLEGSTATRKEMLETIGYHQANAHKFAQQLAERNQQWVKLASLLGCDVESVESELTSVKTELARAKEQATERWLPIETAPESEYVLVFLPNYGHATATRTGRDWWAVNRGERINPTHWQPLPEPPMPIEATAAATNEGKGEGDNEQR